MKIYRFLIIFFVAATTLLVSCEEYEDTVVPGPAADVAFAVGFATDNPAQWEFEPTVVDFDITLLRPSSVSSSALEVPISVVADSTESFIVPSTVTFAAGDSTATLTITINYENAVAGKNLVIGIKVGDDYYNPYNIEYSEYYGVVAILNWVKYAAGTYYSELFDDSWSTDLYNAQGTNMFRFYELYDAGANDLSFTWDIGSEDVTFDPDGYMFWDSGFTYPGYGLMTVYWDSAPYSNFDPVDEIFQFEGYFYLGSGGYGWNDDTFTIVSYY